MRPSLWRVCALTLIALGIAFVCYQPTIPAQDDFGVHFTVPAGAPGSILVTSVDRNSQAERAGIRRGDTIEYGDTAYERAEVLYATPGSRVTVVVNGHPVTMIAHNPTSVGLPLATIVIRLAFLFVAALLAWRRPEDSAARALVVFLWCFGLAIAMSNGVLATPLLSLVVLQFGSAILFLAGTGAAAVFAARFPTGVALPTPRFLARLCVFLVVLSAIALVATEWLPRTSATVSILYFALRLLFTGIALLVIATLIVAYVQGEPAERPRRRWLFLILGLGLLAPLIDVIVQLVFGLQRWVDALSQIPLGFLPIGLAYIILRHRVIDVGFVLNRAVVYGVVSVIVVGIFVIVETLMGKYVESHSHIGSVAVQLAVALVLGFSVRAIHTRVDRFVDTVFFRERHEAESAMRDFAFDAPYITEASVLLRRCVEIVRKHAHASNAAVWLRNETLYEQAEGTFKQSSVDENDPAIVAMRARRGVAELQSLHSSLPGTLAFPMIVRGQLVGMLLCGPKNEEETYAPDERETLGTVAASVAHALDGLRVTELEQTVERLLAGRAGGATQGAMGTF